MKNCDEYKGLIVGLIDRELTTEETARINSHLIRCEACRREYEQLRETSGKLELVSINEPQDEIMDKIWNAPYSRFTRNAALFLVIGGYALLMIYGLFVYLTDDGEALPNRIAIAAIVIGFSLFLVPLLRERWKIWKTDPYKEIKR